MSRPKRILAVARGAGGGDVHPLLAVAFGLRDRGHHVVLLCDAGAEKMVKGLGIRTVKDDAAWPQAVEPPGAVLRAVPTVDVRAGLTRHFVGINAQLAPALANWAAQVEAEVVLTSLLIASAAEQALNGRIPWCVVNTTYYLGNEPENPLAAYLLPILAHAPLVLHATDAVFDGAPRLPAGQHFVGPLLWEPPARRLHYLDEPGDPWALVTVSSIPQDDTAIVMAALGALRRRRVRVLVTIGGADLRATGTVRIERYVSHTQVLARSALMVSHAGHGSVMKALVYGVPMVLVPWGRDQPGVADRAERLGVARVVSPDALEGMDRAVADVLDDPRFKHAAQAHHQRLASFDPIRTACELIEALA
jgi:UDP:flavonoid glycosyltransferase YjiC (YdhE family)